MSSQPPTKMGLVFTYNNKPHANKAPLPNVPMTNIPMPNAPMITAPILNYRQMNRYINNSSNPTSMSSIIRTPGGSCSSCGN